jgi:hypothetical protein
LSRLLKRAIRFVALPDELARARVRAVLAFFASVAFARIPEYTEPD